MTQRISFLIMSITFLNYYKASQVQGIDRKTMPYYGSFTTWSVSNFFSNYTMQLVAPCPFFGWKLVKKTRYIRAHEVDLVWQRPGIDAYENSVTTPPVSFWTEMG
ncbi:hypothetical protein CNMCM8980_004877 [Aspergillus fumigatiaffinis]|nr:hypothetical protein CNMCM8980_004877 [Aspergillus fumigatiaffinis]